MRVEVAGVPYANFLRVAVEVSLDQLSRRFEFEAATRGIGDIPFRPGQPASIWIDDERVVKGWIEKIEVAAPEGAEEMTYTVSGRDLMADVVDSQVDGLGEFGSTMLHAAGAVLRFLGVDAKVVDRSGSGRQSFGAASEIAKPDVGETAADFLWGLASRRQLVLCSDGDGNLVLHNGDPRPTSGRIIHRADGDENNVTGMQFSSDHSKRFHLHRVVSQPNVASMSFDDIELDAEIVATVEGQFVDNAIRRSRRRTIAGEASYSAADARLRARWEANLARAEGLVYVATVPSWRDASGALWEVNTAPVVEDDFAGVSTRMAITDLVFTDSDQGPTTTLTLRRRDAYAAQAALTEMERRAQVAADKASSGESTVDPELAAALEELALE